METVINIGHTGIFMRIRKNHGREDRLLIHRAIMAKYSGAVLGVLSAVLHGRSDCLDKEPIEEAIMQLCLLFPVAMWDLIIGSPSLPVYSCHFLLGHVHIHIPCEQYSGGEVKLKFLVCSCTKLY